MKLVSNFAVSLVALGAVCLIGSLTTDAKGQNQPGKAKVQAITGSAVYSVAGGPAVPLKVGTVLDAGATIKTAKDSTVDLFLGKSAGVIRIIESTTLSLDKLGLIDTGADTVVDIQLNLPEGTMLFNVNKLSAASKYEIKVPNGVAGIRGTKGRINANSFIVLQEGRFVFVYVPPGGQPTPYTLTAPPVVYFSPTEGVKVAPPELIRELAQQLKDLGGPAGPPSVIPPPITPPTDREKWTSPGIGK